MKIRPLLRIAAVILAAAGLAACASLDLSSMIRKPTLEIVGFEVERLTFEEAGLRLDVKVTNPNGVGIQLAGFDYSLVIEGAELVKGAVDHKVSLRANGSSVIPVPVSFGYKDLFAAVRALGDKDESPYELTVGFTFSLPVLDKVKVTAAHKGTLPVVRVPTVRVASLRLDGLTLQGASLVLRLELANANGFGLSLSSLDYRFAVANQSWATGTSRRAVQIGSRQKGLIDIPINLDFYAVGRTARDSLMSVAPLSYELSARLGVGTTLPLLKSATIPVELKGQVGILR